MSARHYKVSTRSILIASAAAFVASAALAQQSTRFPNGQAIPLAGIGIAIDEAGRKITYDLDTEEIISIEIPRSGQIITNIPEDSSRRIAAPQRVERAPLGQPESSDFATATPEFDEQVPEDPNFGREQLPEDGTMQSVVPPMENDPFTEPQRVGPEPTDETQTAAIVKPDNPNLNTKPEFTAKLQILLDRLGLSPGVIDGRNGSNVRKAMTALSIKYNRDLSSLSPEELDAELESTGGPAFLTYTITPEDTNGPFVSAIPVDYAEKAKLPEMSYTSALEALAEKFHMDENYMKKLNPGVDFSRAGTTIQVANTGEKIKTKIFRIEADKGAEQVRAYDEQGNLVVAYPATIGSTATPSPSGTVTIERIALDPNYTYNPKINFTQGENKSVLTIPPGPNGPVGNVWLALSKPTYGIHGTPDPSKIGKSNSHGCVRLTNWDAQELAGMVSRGVTVEFLD
ncbi:L,D-transpeptidase [Ahrensia kielensis]|uniref:L,D-transpeptidase n=1 Tax=Ahrensia kielensis TaxID=76980 RepID=A0ABU9T919_9HYPH